MLMYALRDLNAGDELQWKYAAAPDPLALLTCTLLRQFSSFTLASQQQPARHPPIHFAIHPCALVTAMAMAIGLPAMMSLFRLVVTIRRARFSSRSPELADFTHHS